MNDLRKRYRAFISYSHHDAKVARRLHRTLETYRLPNGIDAPVGADRRLGRFFRDDDELAATPSLGAAIKGALDDSENLIVVCSPAAARASWVDEEVKRFKRQSDARVFAVIVEGEPNARDPSRECFPPSLKVKVDPDGNPTREPDEPRASDLQKRGLRRVRIELAAGLLGVPFDVLWQRDRRRVRRMRGAIGVAALAVAGVLLTAAIGWVRARTQGLVQAAEQETARARQAAADGRAGEALIRLAPFAARRPTRQIVDAPLRTLLGWSPAPEEQLTRAGWHLAAFRGGIFLVDPGRVVHDISQIGYRQARVVASRDSKRLLVTSDLGAVVFDIPRQESLPTLPNREVEWIGSAFEAPSGLLVVTGAIVGPTNGSVIPYVLTVPADGSGAKSQRIGPFLFGSALGVTKGCDTLLVATKAEIDEWQLHARALGAAGLGEPVDRGPLRFSGAYANSHDAARVLEALAGVGSAAAAETYLTPSMNPFTRRGCAAPTLDEWYLPETKATLSDHFAGNNRDSRNSTQFATLDLDLPVERRDRWQPRAAPRPEAPLAPAYVPACSDARPCPIVGGDTSETFSLDVPRRKSTDMIGPPPRPRWERTTTSRQQRAADRSIYFERLELNSYHQLGICRRSNGRDACFQTYAGGEDHLGQNFARSPDGRFVYWPFGGLIVDLDRLRTVTDTRTIPEPPGRHFDFEVDRPGLTVAIDGRLLTFLPKDSDGTWSLADESRTSGRYGVLLSDIDTSQARSRLHSFVSLGNRQYLAVRTDGTLARLDATGREVWRIVAAGLGNFEDVVVNPERSHALVIGRSGWRLFRLDDGFPVSGLLRPPEDMSRQTDGAPSPCRLADVPGSGGEISVACRDSVFVWEPRRHEGDVTSRLARVVCTADRSAPPIEILRRCLVEHSSNR